MSLRGKFDPTRHAVHTRVRDILSEAIGQTRTVKESSLAVNDIMPQRLRQMILRIIETLARKSQSIQTGSATEEMDRLAIYHQLRDLLVAWDVIMKYSWCDIKKYSDEEEALEEFRVRMQEVNTSVKKAFEVLDVYYATQE